MKYSDRKEARTIREIMNALLFPMIPYLNETAKECVEKTLRILNEIEIVGEEDVIT